MATERRRAYYAGRVQGVGFRFTTHRIAEGFPVTGTVRNLDDGRVEVVAEGETEAVDAFLAAIRTEMGSKIQSVSTSSEAPGDPPFDRFMILT